MHIGICFGGYCPLHRGHMDVIMRARKECNKTFIVVCGYDNEPRAEEIKCDLNTRYSLIKKFLTDDITSVIRINDTELGLDESCSFENWQIWTSKVMEEINDGINHIQFLPKLNSNITKSDIYFYVSEPSYVDPLESLGFNVILMERTKTKISGTEIRRNPLKYWKYITEPFRPYLVTKILVVGTASEGKTTLCRDISHYYNIPWVPEYGREYMELSGLTDVDLTINEFKEFIDGQTKTTLNCIAGKGADTGLIISDTDNLITLMYAHAYATRDDMPNMNIDAYNELETYAQDNIKAIDWDYIIILSPTKNFVDDGTRFMGQSSMQERINNYDKLANLIFKYYEKPCKIVVNAKNHRIFDPKHNFNEVCKIIDNLYAY